MNNEHYIKLPNGNSAYTIKGMMHVTDIVDYKYLTDEHGVLVALYAKDGEEILHYESYERIEKFTRKDKWDEETYNTVVRPNCAVRYALSVQLGKVRDKLINEEIKKRL